MRGTSRNQTTPGGGHGRARRVMWGAIALGCIAAAVGLAARGMLVLERVRQEETARALASTQEDLAHLQTALSVYKAKRGRYPATSEGLRALVEAEVLQAVPRDRWGHDYVYTNEGGTPVIVSHGADGRPGGSGADADLVSRAPPPH